MAFGQRAKAVDLLARIALIGGPGGGKTKTALILARALARATGNKKVGVIETERKRIEHYAKEFEFYPEYIDPPFTPQRYAEKIRALGKEDSLAVGLIDSLSHAWTAEGGALQMHDQAVSKFGGNKYAAWAAVTPHQQDMCNAMLGLNKHLIVTMRAKEDVKLVKNDKGKTEPISVGVKGEQRGDLGYEFDFIGLMLRSCIDPMTGEELPVRMEVLKSVLGGFKAGDIINTPGDEFCAKIVASLSLSGASELNPAERKEAAKPTGSTGLTRDDFTEEERQAMREKHGVKSLAQFNHFVSGKTKEQVVAAL
jgi:hypothetical protein